jgi:16S rRNA (guanine966-N2)-methyltransferase
VRITGGRWAGRTLVSPAGRVRPTAEAVREAAMALVRDALDGARVLDLFAGTGALGLEALSRGAAACDFIENHASALHALKANVTQLHARDRCRIFKRDAIPFVEHLERMSYDLAFTDPPYGSRKLDRVIARWVDSPFSAILVIEHAAAHEITVPGRSRRIEDTTVTVLRARGRAAAKQQDGGHGRTAPRESSGQAHGDRRDDPRDDPRHDPRDDPRGDRKRARPRTRGTRHGREV